MEQNLLQMFPRVKITVKKMPAVAALAAQLQRSTFNIAIVVVHTTAVDCQFEYAGQSSLMNVPFSVMWLNGNRYSILDNPFNIQGQN